MTVTLGGVFSRLRPVRRLTRQECDALGFEGPLVVSERQHRWMFAGWRPSKGVEVHRSTDVVWSGTREELERLGVRLDDPS